MKFLKLFTSKYRIYCNRWMVVEKDGKLEIANEETFPTQYAGNNDGKLQARCYKLFAKHTRSNSEYCYQFYIDENKQEKEVRKM